MENARDCRVKLATTSSAVYDLSKVLSSAIVTDGVVSRWVNVPNECSRKPRHHPWKDAHAERGMSRGITIRQPPPARAQASGVGANVPVWLARRDQA
jgi:hypothetical protein